MPIPTFPPALARKVLFFDSKYVEVAESNTDVEEAKSFYTDYLGLRTEEFNLGWVARYSSPETGAHLQLVSRDATAPESPLISVMVDDVDEAYADAQERGFEIDEEG